MATATFRTELSAKLIALTIDDGPTREWTPQVLRILRRRDTKATFFRVGKRAQAEPGLVMQTADAGHEQGNHTWAHDDLTRHDETFDRDSLERTAELLAKLTGQRPRAERLPGCYSGECQQSSRGKNIPPALAGFGFCGAACSARRGARATTSSAPGR